jgi:hypothetical protein
MALLTDFLMNRTLGELSLYCSDVAECLHADPDTRYEAVRNTQKLQHTVPPSNPEEVGAIRMMRSNVVDFLIRHAALWA